MLSLCLLLQDSIDQSSNWLILLEIVIFNVPIVYFCYVVWLTNMIKKWGAREKKEHHEFKWKMCDGSSSPLERDLCTCPERFCPLTRGGGSALMGHSYNNREWPRPQGISGAVFLLKLQVKSPPNFFLLQGWLVNWWLWYWKIWQQCYC